MNPRASLAGTVCAAALVFAAGCKTAPILSAPPIPVPGGLTPAEIQIAILTAVTNRAQPPQYEVRKVTAGPGAETLAWSLFGDTQRRVSGWAVEEHQPGVITLGFDSRGHYMQVAVRYDAQSVATELVGSRGLDQAEGRIHKKANAWLAKLQGRIRVALSQVAALHAGTAPPTR